MSEKKELGKIVYVDKKGKKSNDGKFYQNGKIETLAKKVINFNQFSFEDPRFIYNVNRYDTVYFTIQEGKPKNIRRKNMTFFLDNCLDLSTKEDIYVDFCEYAQEYGKILKKQNVTTSMIRKIYSKIMNAETTFELKILRPQLVYIAGKNEDKSELIELMMLLDSIIKEIAPDNNSSKKDSEKKENSQIKSFKMFMEAIVAYRKFAGKDN